MFNLENLESLENNVFLARGLETLKNNTFVTVVVPEKKKKKKKKNRKKKIEIWEITKFLLLFRIDGFDI